MSAQVNQDLGRLDHGDTTLGTKAGRGQEGRERPGPVPLGLEGQAQKEKRKGTTRFKLRKFFCQVHGVGESTDFQGESGPLSNGIPVLGIEPDAGKPALKLDLFAGGVSRGAWGCSSSHGQPG
jgi:hypothetical protein